MKIVVPDLKWIRGYFRPEQAHLQETCDGKPRLADRGDQFGMVPVAVCGAWLGTQVVDPETAGTRCVECADRASRIGGIV